MMLASAPPPIDVGPAGATGVVTTSAGDGYSLLLPLFFFALFCVIAVKLYQFWKRNQGPHGRGDFGPGGPGWDFDGPPPRGRGPQGDPDGLLEVPWQWVEAYGKWAKKVVRDAKSNIRA